MRVTEPKQDLQRYLRAGREAVVWKVQGLSEYDVRRPLVPTGTNLLGLVKHLASVEAGYLGFVFGRPYEGAMPWLEEIDSDPHVDLFATPDESREALIELYLDVARHADDTIGALELADMGTVPWWGERGESVTLHRILVHVATETHRHAGHADIVRELIDGRVGLNQGNDNLGVDAADDWRAHHDRVEQAAREASRRST